MRENLDTQRRRHAPLRDGNEKISTIAGRIMSYGYQMTTDKRVSFDCQEKITNFTTPLVFSRRTEPA